MCVNDFLEGLSLKSKKQKSVNVASSRQPLVDDQTAELRRQREVVDRNMRRGRTLISSDQSTLG